MATKKEGRALLAEAKKKGKEWAREYLDGERFQDYLAEQLRCGEVPVDDLPETKKQANRVARDIIADLWNDMQQQYDDRDVLREAGVSSSYDYGSADWFKSEYGFDREDLISAWWDGVSSVFSTVSTRSWLGNEVKFRADECREGQREEVK